MERSSLFRLVEVGSGLIGRWDVSIGAYLGRLWVGFREEKKMLGEVHFVTSGFLPRDTDDMNRTVGSKDLQVGCRDARNPSESVLLLGFACKVGFRVHKVEYGGKVTIAPHSPQYRRQIRLGTERRDSDT